MTLQLATAILNGLSIGKVHSLFASNQAGTLWERTYRKREDGKIEAITCASGSFQDWKIVDGPEDMVRTAVLINEIRGED